jgi:predicted Fe-Mo cluster-binding NifX family protein
VYITSIAQGKTSTALNRRRNRGIFLMSKVAVTMSDNRIEAPMSSHFGKAPWIMVADSENGVVEFAENDAQQGRGVASIVASHECTDVVLVGIGGGALRHLQMANINAWAVEGPVTGQEALHMFVTGKVKAAMAEESHQGDGGGCCCGHGGHGSACCHS